MKPEEVSAQKYLRKNYGKNIVFEPRGKDTAPDFSMNDTISVEVRRLNQHFFDEEKTEGLEQLSFPIYKGFKEVLSSFNPQYSGKSYSVDMQYKRPLDKSMKQIKLEMQIALRKFLRSELTLPCTIWVNEKIQFHIGLAEAQNGLVFWTAAEEDDDAGGGVVSVYIENIRYCITDKLSKIVQYKSGYKECWLCLVDYLNFGLAQSEIEQVKSTIKDLGEFAKVIMIDHTGEFLLLEISPK